MSIGTDSNNAALPEPPVGEQADVENNIQRHAPEVAVALNGWTGEPTAANFHPPAARKASGGVTVVVHGAEYELPPATDDQLRKSAQIASTNALNFLPASAQGPHLDGGALTIRLRELRDQLSRSAAEDRALADAGATHLGKERLRRDITQLRALGSHYVRHQVDGMNPERIRKWLPADRDTQKIIQICEDGVVADTDPKFVRTRRIAPLRDLQK